MTTSAPLLPKYSIDDDDDESLQQQNDNDRYILVIGPAGSGKTTLVKYLCDNIAAYKPLKRSVLTNDGISSTVRTMAKEQQKNPRLRHLITTFDLMPVGKSTEKVEALNQLVTEPRAVRNVLFQTVQSTYDVPRSLRAQVDTVFFFGSADVYRKCRHHNEDYEESEFLRVHRTFIKDCEIEGCPDDVDEFIDLVRNELEQDGVYSCLVIDLEKHKLYTFRVPEDWLQQNGWLQQTSSGGCGGGNDSNQTDRLTTPPESPQFEPQERYAEDEVDPVPPVPVQQRTTTTTTQVSFFWRLFGYH